ncbi:unnamed protein product [Ostreobium quekettii]|uniref:Uncharacterized protein n=1 Tax=Ostreobium quekettii TaxID=121088 RepID=A0A8S1ISN0_9CHLO|nr:unnamed protein product [Ostreobium quekettii]
MAKTLTEQQPGQAQKEHMLWRGLLEGLHEHVLETSHKIFITVEVSITEYHLDCRLRRGASRAFFLGVALVKAVLASTPRGPALVSHPAQKLAALAHLLNGSHQLHHNHHRNHEK